MWIKDIRDYILYEDKDILVCHKPAGLAVAVKAPVAIGDVILKDICGTGADVVATRNVAVKI